MIRHLDIMKFLLGLGLLLAVAVLRTEAVVCKADSDCGSGECCYIEPEFLAVVCKADSDCGSGECCYIEPEFLVASKKRQLSLAPKPSHHDTGVCESMLSAGDMCNMFSIMNGHCGCPSGMSCKWVPDHTTPAMPVGHKARRRGMVPHNESGSYRCA